MGAGQNGAVPGRMPPVCELRWAAHGGETVERNPRPMRMPSFLSVRVLRLIVLVASIPSVMTALSEMAAFGQEDGDAIKRPVVFLDRSPRIVEYQLKRLDNTRLLLVERAATDAKYIPVYDAILRRPGIARQQRDEALEGLVALRKSDPVEVLLDALGRLDHDTAGDQQVARQLTGMLMEQPALDAALERLIVAAGGNGRFAATAAFVALMSLNRDAEVLAAAGGSDDALAASLSAVSLLSAADLRNRQRNRITDALGSSPSLTVRQAAVRALAETTAARPDSFRLIAALLPDSELRSTAVQALLKLADPEIDREVCREVVDSLVSRAERLEAEERTTDEFIDEMQLVDALLGRLAAADASGYRQRLRAVTVRIVRLRTVLEEMRYDTAWFAVEAGRPVQVIIQNDDLMPHNFVVTSPGQLQFVAEEGANAGPEPSGGLPPYVPSLPEVLQASPLVDAGRQQRLTFNAPTEPGEYPYVCTFPRHWMRMYGVMVVVPDLDAFQQDPVAPMDPLGNNRTFVKNWTLPDLIPLLPASASADREPGKLLFREATCAQCHRIDGAGGQVGPDLSEVLTRWKGDYKAVLREILEPSYRIEPQYTVQLIITNDGRTISGIVKAETDTALTVVENPEAKAPTVIPRSEIEEIVPSTTSMMPKALLDKFTAEEIMEILNYVCREPAGQADGN